MRTHTLLLSAAAASLTALISSCASMQSIAGFEGHSQLEIIKIFDPKRNADREVDVVLYFPTKQAEQKPSVLLLSGCNASFGQAAQVLVKRLTAAGVVVAEVKSIESFGDSCVGQIPLLGAARARHIDVARAVLVEKKIATDDNIALLGFSHGGWTIMESVLEKRRWAAAVAYYPYCSPLNMPMGPSVTPTLILAGSADTWTPPAWCNEVVERAPLNFTVKTYEGATHAFDYQKPTRTVDTNNGPSVISYDHAATVDSIERSLTFLLTNLKR